MFVRLQECVITSDDVVDDEDEMVHYEFYAYTEPDNVVESLKDSSEEWEMKNLKSIKKVIKSHSDNSNFQHKID